MSETERRLVPVPARLFARSQSDRASFLKAQGPSAQGRSPNLRGALASHRQHLRPLRATGMLELPQGRRICVRVIVRCSSAKPAGETVALGEGAPQGTVVKLFKDGKRRIRVP